MLNKLRSVRIKNTIMHAILTLHAELRFHAYTKLFSKIVSLHICNRL